MQEIVTPARVAAVLAVVAPYALSTFEGFRQLAVPVQVTIIGGIVVVGCVFIAAYTHYTVRKLR